MYKGFKQWMKSFIKQLPMNACEAKQRIEGMTDISRSPFTDTANL
jgi:hypothetical protein